MLDRVQPYTPGGGTVLFVSEHDYVYAELTDRHQGGTPNIAGAIALAESLNFLSKPDLITYDKHEVELTEYALNKMKEIAEIIFWVIYLQKTGLGLLLSILLISGNGLVADILE